MTTVVLPVISNCCSERDIPISEGRGISAYVEFATIFEKDRYPPYIHPVADKEDQEYKWVVDGEYDTEYKKAYKREEGIE